MMKQIAVIETIGSITKSEGLQKVENNVLPDTMVLRNLNPFPGHIFNQDDQSYIGAKYSSIYIILHYRYAPEKVMKLSSMFKPQLQMDCNAGYGEINMGGYVFPCIRVKGLKYLNSIDKLQEFIKFHGFKLMRSKQLLNEGIIKVYKQFKILEIEHNLYRDYFDREKFYIQLPVNMEWEPFNKLNNLVKSRINENNYDAALGEIYRFNGPVRIIRIFNKDKSLEKALDMKKLYYEELQKELILW